ncbi:MAG: cytochrome ubiquinol oxidase subunit II [Paracoccaceae bacterium]|nr:cytochrome ubiquinol oxidase subunit II [Paracoccaceae bacterium]
MRGRAGPVRAISNFKRRTLGLAALVAALPAVACAGDGTSFLEPAGPIAALQKFHLIQITLISLIVVLPVLVLVPLLAWRYRASNTSARYMPDWDFSHALEYVMWLVPVAVVAVLSVYLWIDTHKLDPYKQIASAQKPLQVEVVGLDWKWLFIYPEFHIATVGQMAFPKDRPVALKLTSDTVMQSFMVSALGGQIYDMPGMVTKLNLQADRVGSFHGVNTQFTGDGFQDQTFTAMSMTNKDFDAWVAKVQKDGIALNEASYRVLGHRSTPDQVHATLGTPQMPQQVVYFNDVPSGFFNKVVMKYTSGKAIPATRQPGAVAYGQAPVGE